jgi:hypothetical protein
VRDGEWRPADSNPSRPLAFSIDQFDHCFLKSAFACSRCYRGIKSNHVGIVHLKARFILSVLRWLSLALGKAQASGAGADANAVCIETRKNLRCLSSDRRHAGTEGAVGPTEMCAMSRPDLGSESGACRAESLSQVWDRCRDKRAGGE